MLKKVLTITLTLSLLLATVAGCGSKADSNSDQPAKGETTTIRFWDGNWNEESFKQVQEIWEKEHPDIKLVGEFQVDDGMSDKYVMALKNGSAPDVVACALDWVTTFGNADLLAPLDEYMEADKVDASQFVPGAIEASTINDSLYGLPFRSETYTLFYNKDILAAAGYNEPPKTWEEVKEVAAACTSEDVAGYGLCGANFSNFSFQFINMLRSSGGDVLTEDYSKSALDTDVALQTAQLYKDLQAYAPASLLENNNIANRTLFASGKVAMYLSGIYDVPEIIKANPELNFASTTVPTANDAELKTILGGWSVAIPKTSENKDAAWEFVKFLTRPDIAAMYSNTFTGTGDPADRFKDVDPAIVQPCADALPYAAALPSVPQIVGMRQAIFDNMVLCLSDSMTVEESIAATSDAVTKLLEQ